MDWKVTTEPTAEPLHLDEAKLHLRVDTADDDALITSLIKAVRQWCEGFQNRSYVLQTIGGKLDGFANRLSLPGPLLREVTSIEYIDIAGDTQTLSTSVYSVDTTTEPGLVTLAYNQSWPCTRSQHHAVSVNYKVGYVVPFTVNTTSNVITAIDHTYSDGDIVQLSNSGGAVPAGLAVNTNYYVRDDSGNTLKLAATSDGEAIDITGEGTGTSFLGIMPGPVLAAMKLLIGHLYDNRETTSPLTIQEVPLAARSLLTIDRIYPV